MTNEEIRKANMADQEVVFVTEEQSEFVRNNPTAQHLNVEIVAPDSNHIFTNEANAERVMKTIGSALHMTPEDWDGTTHAIIGAKGVRVIEYKLRR